MIGCRDVLTEIERRLVAVPLEVLGCAALWVEAAACPELEADGDEQAVSRGGGDAQCAHIAGAKVRRAAAGKPHGKPLLERCFGDTDHARRDTPQPVVLFDEPGRTPVPPWRRGKHGIEPGAFQFAVVRPRKSGRPAEEKARRAFALHALDQCFDEMRRYVRQPEQPESGGARFRETNETIDPPRGQLPRPLRILKTRGHRLQTELSLTGVDDVVRSRPIEPVRRRAGHGTVHSDAVENHVEQQRESRLAGDRRQLLDRRIGVPGGLQGRVGSLEIVREKNVAVGAGGKNRPQACVRKAHAAHAT